MQFMLGTPPVDYFAPENKILLEAFSDFLKKEYSEENLNFLKALQTLETLKGKALDTGLKAVYDQYIKTGAASEINISSGTQKFLKEAVIQEKRPPELEGLKVMQSAVDEVQGLTKRDSFSRFIQTPEYAKAQQTIEKQKVNQPPKKGILNAFKMRIQQNFKSKSKVTPSDFTPPPTPRAPSKNSSLRP